MCTFCDVTISDVRAAGFLAVYLKYLKHEAVKDEFVKGVPILTAASDIMNENDASIAGNLRDVEYMIHGIEEAIQSPSGQSHGWFAFELGKSMLLTLHFFLVFILLKEAILTLDFFLLKCSIYNFLQSLEI